MYSIQAGRNGIFIDFLIESNNKECFFSFKGPLRLRSEILVGIFCVKKKKCQRVGEKICKEPIYRVKRGKHFEVEKQWSPFYLTFLKVKFCLVR